MVASCIAPRMKRKTCFAGAQTRFASASDSLGASETAKTADAAGKTSKSSGCKNRSSRRRSASSFAVGRNSSERLETELSRHASELQFRVDDDNGRQIGSASISVVGPAMGGDGNNATNQNRRRRSDHSLRRNVIDRMIKENGWVVNDYQKEIGGKKVYVVVAQSAGAGGRFNRECSISPKSTDASTALRPTAPTDSSERIAQESEKVINSLQRTATSSSKLARTRITRSGEQ